VNSGTLAISSAAWPVGTRCSASATPPVSIRSSELERFLTGHVPGLDIVFRTDDNGTLVGLVSEGLGAAVVVPRLVVNPRNPAVVALPLGSRVPPRVLAIVWHRDRYRSAASHAFADLARELGADYAARISESSSAAAASTSRRPGR
jgi:DNA-binding transcriptional LysR family regulator